MLALVIDALDQADWQQTAEGFLDLSLPQSWAYGAAKATEGPWRVERGIFREDKAVVGTVQVMLRPLPAGLPGGLAWISRGPVWRRAGNVGPERISALLAALRRHYVEERGFYVRMAPPLADAALPMEMLPGFVSTATAGWASARVDLTLPVDALRAGLQQKWRNVLNKAERTTMAIERLTPNIGDGRFAAFLDDYRNFLAERRIGTTVTPGLLRALAAADGGRLDLLAAMADGTVLGWALIARSGETAEYLAGVLGDGGRRQGAGQNLLWHALLAAKTQGCTVFDVGGLDPELTPDGIRHFKEGLGGTPYRLANEIEALPAGPLGRLVRWRVGRARMAA